MYERTGRLVGRKFKEFFIPTVIISISLSLSLVVDGMMVGNILGTTELAAVNLVLPVSLFVNTACVLLGVGGCTLVALSKGERDKVKANHAFTVAAIGILALGAVTLLLGIFLSDAIAGLLTTDAALLTQTKIYLRIYLLGAPLMMFVTGITYFIRSDGNPRLASIVLLVANILNLFLDYAYMRFFNLGIAGAALATITGYAAGFLILIIHVKSPRRTLKFTRIKKGMLRMFAHIASAGVSGALGQLLLFVKILLLNSLVLSLGGQSGIVALTVCMSCLSLTSMFVSGAAQTMIPLIGTFYGEQDSQGVRHAAIRALAVVMVAAAVLVIIFEAAPKFMLSLYGVTADADIAVGITAIRLFSFSLIGTGFSFLMMYYTQTIRMKKFSVGICICQGIAVIVPAAYIMSWHFGLEGLWISFIIAELVTAAFIFSVNAIIRKRSKGEVRGLFMLKKQDASLPIMDVTIDASDRDAVGLSQRVIEFCGASGVNSSKSNLLGMVIEDTAVNIAECNKTRAAKGFIDITIRIHQEQITVSFRDDGMPFDPTKFIARESDAYHVENIETVKKIATSIHYERIIGLNCTTIAL